MINNIIKIEEYHSPYGLPYPFRINKLQRLKKVDKRRMVPLETFTGASTGNSSYPVDSRANRALDSLLHPCYTTYMSRIPDPLGRDAHPPIHGETPNNSIFSHYQVKLREGQNPTDSMKLYEILKKYTPAEKGIHVSYNKLYRLPGSLTKQEYGTATAWLNGVTVQFLAQEFKIDPKSIARRIDRTMKKLGCVDRAALRTAIERIDYDNLK